MTHTSSPEPFLMTAPLTPPDEGADLLDRTTCKILTPTPSRRRYGAFGSDRFPSLIDVTPALADDLRQRRKAAGISGPWLSARLGHTRNYMFEIEKRRIKTLDRDVYLEILDLCGEREAVAA